MRKIAWNTARFITSSTKPSEYPKICNKHGTSIPQIAIAGRSNVGKSRLINSIFANKRIAKVSQTPGKTQLLNYFMVDEALICVDLPGYGFAKCPKSVKKDWGTMIDTFFKTPPSLATLLFLLDSRRIPNDEDKELLTWAS